MLICLFIVVVIVCTHVTDGGGLSVKLKELIFQGPSLTWGFSVVLGTFLVIRSLGHILS